MKSHGYRKESAKADGRWLSLIRDCGDWWIEKWRREEEKTKIRSCCPFGSIIRADLVVRSRKQNIENRVQRGFCATATCLLLFNRRPRVFFLRWLLSIQVDTETWAFWAENCRKQSIRRGCPKSAITNANFMLIHSARNIRNRKHFTLLVFFFSLASFLSLDSRDFRNSWNRVFHFAQHAEASFLLLSKSPLDWLSNCFGRASIYSAAFWRADRNAPHESPRLWIKFPFWILSISIMSTIVLSSLLFPSFSSMSRHTKKTRKTAKNFFMLEGGKRRKKDHWTGQFYHTMGRDKRSDTFWPLLGSSFFL